MKVAFIGFGTFAQKRYKSLLALKSIEVTGAFDSDSTISFPQELHRFLSLEEVLEHQQIDLIIISTPNNTHWELIKLCALHNKFPFCEKPFAINSKELLESYEDCSPPFYMGSNLLFFPAMIMAKKFIKVFINDIKAIEVSIGVDQNLHPQSWRKNSFHVGGGSLMDNGIHLARFLTNIFNNITLQDAHLKFLGGIETQAILKMVAKNIPITLSSSWENSLQGYAQVKVQTSTKNYTFFANENRVLIKEEKSLKIKERSIFDSGHSLEKEMKFFLKRYKEPSFVNEQKLGAQKSLTIILNSYGASDN